MFNQIRHFFSQLFSSLKPSTPKKLQKPTIYFKDVIHSGKTRLPERVLVGGLPSTLVEAFVAAYPTAYLEGKIIDGLAHIYLQPEYVAEVWRSGSGIMLALPISPQWDPGKPNTIYLTFPPQR